ncbi:MAG: Crp/Fnr family transcriptional regulator [Enterobacteriaceae bacterium]
MSRMNFSQIDLIDLLSMDDNEEFLSVFLLRHYGKGELLPVSPPPESAVFIVKEGKIRVGLALEGREFTLTYLQAGDIFTTHARTQLLAQTDTTVWSCNTRRFSRYLLEHPQVGLRIISILGGMLNNSLHIIEELVFASVNQRLARVLLQLAIKNGQETEEGVLLHLDLTMDALGTLASTSRQTASQLINTLQRQGILLKRGRKHYLIPDLSSLAALAQS